MAPKVILGSASTIARQLFQLHFPNLFESEECSFISPEVDETSIGRDAEPDIKCQKKAEAQMDWIMANKSAAELSGVKLIITCDMVVKYRGQTREKPVSEAEARAFLEDYRLNPNEKVHCFNGIVIRNIETEWQETYLVVATHFFLTFSPEAIDELLKDDLVYAMPGAFSPDHPPMGKYITGVSGSATAIAGLPVDFLRTKLRDIDPALPCALKPLGQIKCVIFDMDGLLLDTERLYSVAHQKVLDRFDLEFTYEVKAKMMGRKALDSAKVMIDHFQLQGKLDPEEFVQEREGILDQLFPKSELMAGVQRLLVHLRKNNVPMAIATSSHMRHYTIKTQLHGELFGKVFHHVVTGDKVKESKPHPEIFIKAFEKFGLKDISLNEVLVFEDAPLGVQAAQRAKMNVVQVSPMPSDCQPNQKIPTMWHFVPEQWGLPPFEQSSPASL